jgi:NAD(P)-dependent dehydrogenase (short-subunit alcohol dehydrogenase family)
VTVVIDVRDKVVLITGASRGIGRATATLFAEEGARVMVHYHRNEKAADDTLRSLSGGPHEKVAADLADPMAVQEMVEATVRFGGRVDVLVNNAGIWEPHPVASVDYATWRECWDRTVKTNLLGPANAIHCCVPHMKRAGGGRIVNVSSRGAFRGEPEGPAYGASKAGLNAMGQSLAKALGGDGIHVFTVAPGFVETDMAGPFLGGPEGDRIRGESPLGRVATPLEVARAIVFLASEGSEFSTGCILDVNGASYLRT